MPVLLAIILANVLISAGSLLGVVTLSIKAAKLQQVLLLLVAMSAGALVGSAFLHLLPEAIEAASALPVLGTALIAFIFFYLFENFFYWRHCHRGHCDIHAFGYLNLVGDAMHNFLDGLIIAAAFLTTPALGVATTLAVALHEIPQEIGDFSVLLYSGFSRQKAILANVLVAMTAILGGIIGYMLHDSGLNLEALLIPLAAGGFLYIATADLMPEIHKEKNRAKARLAFIMFLLGIALMAGLKLIGWE
ncbi:hypothetical protein A2W24_02745 [Microgenomates group bacterium RBG_16_45_19]|nr:MAG: hypothetical protein A2W24_02745 [Microgenomates group bacterium RBG_16_45_19]